ncbi:O-mycaminosyltylonolide 6-deoxyallosyltransferase [Amycolatopsis marina]|uniref:O-mycaminosyltylonolide 6-deoxyallosyltransferase n=1 Tax=Amycolatopsis marina TaxID=490629 RepID=A0A1I1BC90_9PSEU|nr:glycosyltransferase [Amycolatopsis marina]SFB47891.1 O-mycaminosyltylonolide 6-deoxyallosyltransferase [Amycolatopsis marina]
MRVTLVAIGSRGDVQPFLALGAGLRERGHDVRLATHADFRDLTREAGLEYFPVPGSPKHYFESPELIKSLRRSPSALRLARTMPRQTAEAAAAGTAQLDACVRPAFANADLVVSSVFNRNAYLAEPPDVPWALVSWYPNTPTTAFPAMGAPRLPLGGWYNRLSHHISQAAEWRMCRPIVNAYRQRLGKAPLGPRTPFSALERDRPTFYLQSPAVLPAPPDWPATNHMAGYWFWDREWQAPQELVEVVENGPAPVVLSFGSLWPAYPENSLELVADAVRAAGRRLVVVDGPTQDDLPEGVLRLHDVDYTWLFPRAAAVIHHGGFGTGAAVLRAGVPQVVVPIFVDHPFWAATMADLGVAPKGVPGARLSAPRLRKAVAQALGDARMRGRAADVGRCVRSDRGVERVCAILENWVAPDGHAHREEATWAR